MSTYTDMTFEAIRRSPHPLTAAEIYDQSQADSRQSINYAICHLVRQGKIVVVGERMPGSPTRGQRTARIYALAPDATPPDPYDVGEPDPPPPEPIDATPPGAVESEIARLLKARVAAAEDPADPEAALDVWHPYPDTDWPGDAASALADPPDGDAVIGEIRREGYRLVAPPIHDAVRIAARLRAGLPFIGQRMPLYAEAIEEAAAALLERAA